VAAPNRVRVLRVGTAVGGGGLRQASLRYGGGQRRVIGTWRWATAQRGRHRWPMGEVREADIEQRRPIGDERRQSLTGEAVELIGRAH
jgi:hypothetical protein